jgi:hypothetical protein
VHILAAVAEHEAEVISKRTAGSPCGRQARRGVKLGGYRGARFTEKSSKAGPEALKAQAMARAADLKPVIDDIRSIGSTSLGAIARELRARGVPTPRSGTWSPMQVSRLLALIDALPPSHAGVKIRNVEMPAANLMMICIIGNFRPQRL